MGKYDPLGVFLTACEGATVPMTFAEIEILIGSALPPAALRHRAWWSNNPDNSAITRVWRAAGFRAFQVDMAGRSLEFRREGAPEVGFSARNAAPQAAVLDRLWSRLAGTVSLPYGMDLTEPTGDVWDAEIL